MMFENIGSLKALGQNEALYEACIKVLGVPSIEDVEDPKALSEWHGDSNSPRYSVRQAWFGSAAVVLVVRQYECIVIRTLPRDHTEVFFYGRSYAPELLVVVPEDALRDIIITPQGGGEATTAWMLFNGRVIA